MSKICLYQCLIITRSHQKLQEFCLSTLWLTPGHFFYYGMGVNCGESLSQMNGKNEQGSLTKEKGKNSRTLNKYSPNDNAEHQALYMQCFLKNPQK